MKVLKKLKLFYPKLVLHNHGYKNGYVVYDCWDSKKVLGYGNTPKNAYSNAYSNILLLQKFNKVETLQPSDTQVLTFDEWYNLNEEGINIELAESGADREMDFDSEKEFNKRYEIYLNQFGNFKIM